MSTSEEVWEILRCPQCDGLMKVERGRVPGSLACPSCGAAVDTNVDDGDRDEIDVEPDAEVIRSEIEAAEEELTPIPETSSSVIADQSAPIPAPRREEYKMPELISNIGERAWTPSKTEVGKPKLDASRIASTEDERLAPAPEKEEGAVQTHVARKITGWDIDGSDQEVEETEAQASANELKRRLTLIGIAGVSCLFVGLIIYGVIRSLKENDQPVVERVEVKPPEEVARETLTSLERDAMDNAKETFAAAGAAIEAFLNAPTYRERLNFVRDRDRVAPLMEEYYSRNPDGAIKFRQPEQGWSMRPFKSFLVALVEAEDFGTYPTAVERDDVTDTYLVDWESFVGYSEIPWETLTTEKPKEPVLLRARASVGDYYNYGYTEQQWACITLQNNTYEHTIYGYVHFDSPVLEDLKEIMVLHGTSHITIRVVHAGEDKGAKQFLITEAIAKGWVSTDVFKEDGGDPDDAGAEPGLDGDDEGEGGDPKSPGVESLGVD